MSFHKQSQTMSRRQWNKGVGVLGIFFTWSWQEANKLAEFTCKLIASALLQPNVWVVVENPVASRLWRFPPVEALLRPGLGIMKSEREFCDTFPTC